MNTAVKKKKKRSEKLEVGLLAMAVIASSIILFVSVFFDVPNWWDYGVFSPQSVILDVICAIVLMAGFVLLLRKIPMTDKIRKKFMLGSLAYIGIIGLVFMCIINTHAIPYVDAGAVVAAARGAADHYVLGFPYFDFFVLMIRFFDKIFGQNNFLPYYILNLLSLLFVYYFTQKIAHHLFRNNRTSIIVSLLLVLLFPLVYYIALMYGDIIGLGWFIGGVYALVKYVSTRKKRYAAYYVACMIMAVLFKATFSVAILFLAIFGLVYLVKSKKISPLLVSVAAFALSSFCQTAISNIYETRYGLDKTQQLPIPKIMTIAMGFQSGFYKKGDSLEYVTSAKNLAGVPVGAWNNFNGSIASDRSEDDMEKRSIQSLGMSFTTFMNDPLYMLEFFIRKIAYQWSDASYFTRAFVSGSEIHCLGIYAKFKQSDIPVLTNQIISSHSPFREIMSVVGGAWQLIVYSFMAIGFFLMFRDRKMRRSTGALLLAVVVVCGFGFYLIWEAMPRYAIPFLPFIVIVAAYGIAQFSEVSLWQKFLAIRNAVTIKRK